MSDTYLTISNRTKGLYKEKGSKFISHAFPVKSDVEVKDIISQLRKDQYDARHHCYAYTLGFKGEIWRANDDGEPSGTAGKPIYGQIVARSLTNTLVVVTRYFGGTKLGTSGLINAYRTAATDALDKCAIIERTINNVYNISFSYLVMNDIMKLAKEMNLNILNQHFDNGCWIEIGVRERDTDFFLKRVGKIESVVTNHLRTE